MKGIENTIRKAAMGRRRAQRQLFDSYYTLIFQTIYRYKRDHQLAEDLTSITFQRIFNKLHDFQNQGEGAFTKWVRRIAINEALRGEKQRIEMVYSEVIPNVSEEDGEDDGAQNIVALKRMIDQLPSGYRNIIHLYYSEGLTHEEIADYLGISKNTSKSQLLKAKNFLRKIYQYE